VLVAVLHYLCSPMRGVMLVGVNVEQQPVPVRVNVKVSPAPAVQQSGREDDDEPSDHHLRPALNRLGQETAEEQHRQAEQEQRSGMPHSPRQTQQSGSSDSALPLVQQQGRDRGQMVRIEGVTESEYQRNDQWQMHRDIIPDPRSKITDMVRSRRIDSRA
jgi:hypothetical protein